MALLYVCIRIVWIRSQQSDIFVLHPNYKLKSLAQKEHNSKIRENIFLLAHSITRNTSPWNMDSWKQTPGSRIFQCRIVDQLVKKLPCLLWDRKVHFNVHKIPPPSHPSFCNVLILSSHVPLGLPSGLFHSDFTTTNLYEFSSSSCVPHVQSMSSFFIWST